MAFHIYPDGDTASLLGKPAGTPISLAASETMRKFVPLAEHVGADARIGGVPTTFIGIAVSGAPLAADTQLRFELLAHDPDRPGGSPASVIDPNRAVSPATAVTLGDDVNPTGAALAYFAPPFRDNVYLLKIAIEIPGTRFWLRISNTTAGGGSRDFVWVVADAAEEVRQPWIHATLNGSLPVQIEFDANVGEPTAAQSITIRNFGTGPFKVAEVTPAVAAPYVISGLPLPVAPNSSAGLNIGFVTPGAAGEIPPDVFGLVTSDKPDPGPFGQGHNNQFVLSARTTVRSNLWVTKNPMPTDRLAFGLVGAGNGKLYAMGGMLPRHAGGSVTYLDVVEEFDPVTNRWSTRMRMPTARIHPRLAAASNGKIYALGGVHLNPNGSFSFLRNVEEYDPVSNTWATREQMPTFILNDGRAAAANGKIYYVGFGGFRGQISQVGEYDPVSNAWAFMDTMPTSRSEFGLASASNGNLYVVGGFTDNTDEMRVFEEYDPVGRIWETKRPIPVGTRGPGLAGARNGKLYAAGGLSSSGNASTTEYDPATDRWLPKTPMPGGRWSFELTNPGNGKIYAMGSGGDGVLATSIVEYTT